MPNPSRSFQSRLLSHRHDLLLLAEAASWLLLARLALLIMPFRHVVSLIMPKMSPTLVPASDTGRTIQRVRWAVLAAARRVPWRAVCIHQGIAAQRMLVRRGIETNLVYGVAKRADGNIEAHVWAKVADVTVVGGAVAARFTPIAIFNSKSGVTALDSTNEAAGR